VSSKDIRTEFQPDPNAATEALYRTGSLSGAAVNRRHDIWDTDQAYSTGAVTCSACHSPHADNAAMATVLVPSDTQPRVEVGVLGYNAADPPNPFTYGPGQDPINPEGIIPSQNLTEPDYIEFCLVCHGSDGGTSPLPGVTMSTGLRNIAIDWANDQHGQNTGGNSNNGYLKYPWNQNGVTSDANGVYAALNCTTCHGAHGTGNIFNLRESISVGGVQMTVGGWLGDTIGEDPLTPGEARVNQTVYTLPFIGRQTQKQEDHQWGAWCSFCHQHEIHGRDEDVKCTNGHMHGGTQF
jgi:cytochrome c553